MQYKEVYPFLDYFFCFDGHKLLKKAHFIRFKWWASSNCGIADFFNNAID
jgi:hypothetical protein